MKINIVIFSLVCTFAIGCSETATVSNPKVAPSDKPRGTGIKEATEGSSGGNSVLPSKESKAQK